MRTADNNFTVENLVAKYRNYVDEHCPFDDEKMPVDDDAEEQLLITLYTAIASENADRQILDALSKYIRQYKERYSSALTDEELSFLCEHFEEVCSLCFVEIAEHRGARINLPYSEQTEELVKKYLKPSVGSTIFITDSKLCDIAILFPNCIIKGYTCFCEDEMSWWEREIWALAQIRLYSKRITSKILPCQDGCTDEKYLSDVDYVIWGTSEFSSFKGVDNLYRLLPPQCKMLFFMDDKDSAGSNGDTYDIRMSLVKDNAIDTIVSYESNQEWIEFIQKKVLIIADKAGCEKVRLIDTMRNTSMEVIPDSLDSEILWPSYYMAEKPGNGIPLTDIVTFHEFKTRTELIRGDKDWILPEEMKKMPVAVPAKMAKEYKDANLLSKDLDLAESPVFSDRKKFLIRTLKERCVLLFGNNEGIVVGYINKLPESGIATVFTVICLIPKEGIDVRYIAALLLTPEVKKQIVTICQGDVNWRTFPLIMDKVIVPSHSDKERLAFLSEANYEALLSSQKELIQEHRNYTKAVRMRKHALTQSLSSIEAMFYALNSYRIRNGGAISDGDTISRVKGTTVCEAFEFLSKNIEDMMPALEHIAEVDYTFNKPEWVDPEKFIEEYVSIQEKCWLNFKPVITWDEGNNIAKMDLKDPMSGETILKKGDAINMFFFPKDALKRIFENIVSNALSHGFTDHERKDYQLRFFWYTDGISLIIEIDNNGTPIPSDRETSSLFEYGVSTVLHQDGHNGIGCNEIDDIMRRYDGNVEIVSSPDKEFTVKYILKFNHINIVKP